MKITNREKEIIQLVADELTTKEIAAHLYISDETVTSHRRNLMEKLQAKNAAGLIRRGFESGILRVAMSILIMINASICLISQSTSVGLEVDLAHAVVFGDSLNKGDAVQFLWLPEKRAIRAGEALKGDWLINNIGDYSAAFGENNFVPSDHSTSWGYNNVVHGDDGTAWGMDNIIGVNGYLSTSWGEDNIVSNQGATVFGNTNNINGRWNTAWGYKNATSVIAPLVTIFGINNEARDSLSTVWGSRNIGDNELTTVWGKGNRAGGYASTSMGHGNIAKGYGGIVLGTYCDTINGMADQSIFSVNTPLLVVGNGLNNDSRSNALSVFGSGMIKVGSGSAASDLHIKQSETEVNGGTGGIILENDIYNDYWQIHHSGLYLSFSKDGERIGYISDTGSYIDDENFAPENQPVTKSQSSASFDISKIQIGTSSIKKNKKEVKINTTQFLKDYPDMVIYDENGKPFGIDYRQLYLTAIVALQEEIRENSQQKNLIHQNQKSISSLIDQLAELKNHIDQ